MVGIYIKDIPLVITLITIRKKKPNTNTKDEAYGVNIVMALSGLAGMGLVNSDNRSSKRLGKSLLLSPVVGSTAYHATRNLGGNATGRLLALITEYTTGFVGGHALDELVD
jgi:hypothetical protein